MNDKFKDSSLIERLRIGSANLKAPWQTNDYSLIDEAVDEIDRLERELQLARSDADSAIANCDRWREMRDEANEEIKSLVWVRDELKQLVKEAIEQHIDQPRGFEDWDGNAENDWVARARAALRSPEGHENTRSET